VRSPARLKDFLALKKDADPDIPIFIAAKAEYAMLNASRGACVYQALGNCRDNSGSGTRMTSKLGLV
jgi:hypothetical protein